MSYWDDPERRAVALRKRAATRAELGPRLGQAPFAPHRVIAPPNNGGRKRLTLVGAQHPTRDSPA